MSAVKKAMAWSLLHSGALTLHRAGFQRQRAIILLYHRINDEGDPFFPALPVRQFAAQLDYVRREYEVAPLEAVLDWLDAGARGRPRVAITIDDGYPDTYHHALPELMRRSLPASLFLSTAPPETGRALWSDRVRSAVKHARAPHIAVAELGLERLPLASARERLGATSLVVSRMKMLRPAAVEAIVDQITERADPGAPPPAVLTWDQVRSLAHGGVSIGGHTHGHYVLSHLSDEEIEREIATSLALIYERLRTRGTSFAYPNGQPEDYDARAIAALRRLGVRCAVTTRHGFARPGHDRFQLARVYTTGTFLPLFATRTAGLGREARQEVS